MTKTEQAALELLDKILANRLICIAEEDFDFLMEHKELCCKKLLPILAFEIVQLKEGESYHQDKLQKSLLLLAHFEEQKAFEWALELHEYPNALEDETGYFIILYWADILIATLSTQWHKLIETIENPEIHEEFKDACIDALVGLVAKQKIEREVVIQFLQSLYEKILDGDPYDIDLLSTALEASMSLWPGESIEEIKEIFGLDLVDEEMISLSELILAFETGKEECLKELETVWSSPTLFKELFVKEKSSLEDTLWEEKFFAIEQEEIQEIENEWDEYDFEEELEFFEQLENNPQPILPCPELEALSPQVQRKYHSLPRLLLDDPETALEISSELVSENLDTPAFFYYFHESLLTLDAKFQAMELVKKWVDLFPQDLLAKVEYGHYFLRRGEPEKAKTLFSDTWSLAKLYPEKTSFHEIECLRFFDFLGCYFLEIGDVEKAKEQIQILDATNPNSFEYYHLKRKISLHLKEDFLFEQE